MHGIIIPKRRTVTVNSTVAKVSAGAVEHMKIARVNNINETIRKLKQEGYGIYIVSGRNNGEYSNAYKMTTEWLEKQKIEYDKLIFSKASKEKKSKEILENKIDLMIEDSTRISLDLISNGIKVYTINTRYNQKDQTLDRVSKWKEEYLN